MGGSDKSKENKGKSGKRQAGGSSPHQDFAAGSKPSVDELADSEFEPTDTDPAESPLETAAELAGAGNADEDEATNPADRSTAQGWRNLSDVSTGDHPPYEEPSETKSGTDETAAAAEVSTDISDDQFGDWDETPTSVESHKWGVIEDWDDASTGDNVPYQTPEARPAKIDEKDIATGDHVPFQATEQSTISTGETESHTDSRSQADKQNAVTGENDSYQAGELTRRADGSWASRRAWSPKPEDGLPAPAKSETKPSAPNPFASLETSTFVPFDAAAFAKKQSEAAAQPQQAKIPADTLSMQATLAKETPPAVMPDSEPPAMPDDESPPAKPEDEPPAPMPEDEPPAPMPENEPPAVMADDEPPTPMPEDEPPTPMPEDEPPAPMPYNEPHSVTPNNDPHSVTPYIEPHSVTPNNDPQTAISREKKAAEKPGTADGINLTPDQRAANKILVSEDTESEARYDYDAQGRIVDVRVDQMHLQITYAPNAPTDSPATFTLESQGKLVASGVANANTELKLNQRSGVVTCTYVASQSLGSGTPELEKSLHVEKQYDPDGTLVVITTDANTKERLTKEVWVKASTGAQLVGRVKYEYMLASGQPAPAGAPEAQIRATQFDGAGRIQHVYLFATVDALHAHAPRLREDHTFEDKNGLRTEHHHSYDLNGVQPIKLSETEKVIDLANYTTTLTSQTFDAENRLIVHQQVKFNAAGYPDEFHYTDTILHRELELHFDDSGKPHQFRIYDETEGREYQCSFDEHGKPLNESEPLSQIDKRDLLFCQMSTEAIARRFEISKIEFSDRALNLAPTEPRHGDAPTGTLVWKDAANFKQARVAQGTIYDANDRAIGKMCDDGKVTLTGRLEGTFGIVDDATVSAAFHGSGSDGERLDLCWGQNSKAAERKEGLNGRFSNGNVSYLVIGGKLYDRSGRFVAHVDEHGKLSFDDSLRLALADIQDISQFFKLGWKFYGNENGKHRQFEVNSSMSSGRIFLREIAPVAHRPRSEKVDLIIPAEHEVRMSMIINKKSREQIGTFIPPVDCGDSLAGGYIISGSTPMVIPLANFILAVFDVELLSHSGIAGRRIQGLSLGPESQADGTYKPCAGGLVNLQHEVEVENRNLKQKHSELQARQQEEEKAKMRAQGLGFSTADWNSEETLSLLISSGFDNVVNNMKLTAAAKAAYQSARQAAEEHRTLIESILKNAQVDENSLVRVNIISCSLGTANTSDDLAKLKNRVDSPPHMLEDLPDNPDTVSGSLKLPDRNESNGLIHYEIKAGRFYQKGKKDPVAFLHDKLGGILWIDKHGQVYERAMKDFTGAVWQLRFADSSGVDRQLDWISIGNSRIVSVAELRKQAANERTYAKALQEKNPNDDTVKSLQRTVDLERRFNTRLDEVVRNGIPDDPKRPSHLSLAGTLAWLEAGTQQAVRAEQNRDTVTQPVVISVPSLTNQNAAKTRGTACIGHERYQIDGGALYKLSSDHGGAMANHSETASECLAPGYLIKFNGGRQSLASLSHVLLQLAVEGTKSEHRIINMGIARTDSGGALVPGGLIDVDELITQAKSAKEKEALEASFKNLFEKAASNQALNLIEFDQVAKAVQTLMRDSNIAVPDAGNQDCILIEESTVETQHKEESSILASIKPSSLRILARKFAGQSQSAIDNQSTDPSSAGTPLSDFLRTESGQSVPDTIVDLLLMPGFLEIPAYERERSRIAHEMHLPREAVSNQLLLKHMSFGNLIEHLLRPADETSLLEHQREIHTALSSPATLEEAVPEPVPQAKPQDDWPTPAAALSSGEPIHQPELPSIQPLEPELPAKGTLALPAEPGQAAGARAASGSHINKAAGVTDSQESVSFEDLIAPLSQEEDDQPESTGSQPIIPQTLLDSKQTKPAASAEPSSESNISFEQLMAPLSTEAPPVEAVGLKTDPPAASSLADTDSVINAPLEPPVLSQPSAPTQSPAPSEPLVLSQPSAPAQSPAPSEPPVLSQPSAPAQSPAPSEPPVRSQPSAPAQSPAPSEPPRQVAAPADVKVPPKEMASQSARILQPEISEPKTPDFSAGLWTMPDLAELHRRSIEQRSSADTQLGEHLKSFKNHPFVQSKNMDDFARSVKARIQDWDDFRNFDPTEELEWHRSSLNSALNEFIIKIGLPPIRLIIDSWMPGDAEAQYSLGNGVILMRPQDIQNARMVDISRLYHEVLHSEQDTSIIRKIALETLSQHNQLKPGRVMAEYCEQTGLKPNLVSRDWINTAVAASSEWLRTKSDHISDLLRSNPNLSRADVIGYDPELIRAAALTRSLREREESNHQLSRQYELLLFMHDQLSNHLQPHDYVENIQNNPTFRHMMFGYEWFNSESETYDRLNTELVKSYIQEVTKSSSMDAVEKFNWKHKDAVKNILFQIEEDCLNHIRRKRCKHFLGIDLELEANYAAHMLVMFHASGHKVASRLLAFPTRKAKPLSSTLTNMEAARPPGTTSGVADNSVKEAAATKEDSQHQDQFKGETDLANAAAAATVEEAPTKPIAQTREYLKKFEIAEPLVDGFTVVESTESSDPAGRPFSPSRAPVIVDRSTDTRLSAALAAIDAELNDNPDFQKDHLHLAAFFAKQTNKYMNPNGLDSAGQSWRHNDGRIDHAKLIKCYAAFCQGNKGKPIMLGDFIEEAQHGRGGGQSEEQAVMLKILLDQYGVENSLIRGHFGQKTDSGESMITQPNHAWIELRVGNEEYILDSSASSEDSLTLNKTDAQAQFYSRIAAGRGSAPSIDHSSELDENHRRHWVNYENRRWQIAKFNPGTNYLTMHRPEQRTMPPADVIIDDVPLTINEKFKIRNEHGKIDSGWYYRGRDHADNLIMYKPVVEKAEVLRSAVLPEYAPSDMPGPSSITASDARSATTPEVGTEHNGAGQ